MRKNRFDTEGEKFQRFQISNFKFQIPDSRFQIPNSRFQIPNSKFQISKIPNYPLEFVGILWNPLEFGIWNLSRRR
jgi:hypothetical protein